MYVLFTFPVGFVWTGKILRFYLKSLQADKQAR
jgi:hypothetical protein